MKINVAYFLLSLLLLLLPRQVLRRGARLGSGARKGRRFTNPRDQREPGDHALRAGEEFGQFRNYVDLVRGATGSLCLMGVSMATSPNLALAMFLQGAVLVLAILIQTVRLSERVTLYAPVFFIAGLNVGAAGVLPAVLGFAVSWVLNPLLPNPAAFLATLGLVTAGFHLAFRGFEDHGFLVPLALAALPIIVSLVAGRQLSGRSHHART